MNRQNLSKFSTKNYVVLLLTIVFIIFCMSGQQSVSAASEIDTSKPVQLKWFVIGNGDQEDIEIVETEINKYLKTKINATVDLSTFFWGDQYDTQMRVYIAAGEPYDINFTASWALNYPEYSRLGAFTDLTDMFDTYAPKTKALLGNKILKGAEVDGRVYAIPTFNPYISMSSGVLLNRKLVKKYSVDISKIKKLQDLEPIFKKIKSKEPKIISFNPFDQSGVPIVYRSLNYDKIHYDKIPGAVLRDGKSTKVINEYETTDSKALFSLMNKWYKNGYINKASMDDSFFSKNKSNIFANYSKLHAATSQELLLNNKIDMIPVELNKPTLSTNSITGSMQAISYTSSNPERALMFLELVNTDEKLSNLLNFGVEKIHYKKTGIKAISKISTSNESYAPSTGWVFGNQSINYSLPGENPKLWDKLKTDCKNAVASPLLGFSFDSEPVQTKIDKVQDISDKYLNGLCSGTLDQSINLPKMNSEFKKAGLQQVLAEMQRQVDEFVKKNR